MELAVRSIMTETVKIFGERNTATNALRQLIQMNSQSKLSPGTLGELYPVRAEVLRRLRRIGLPSEVAERYTDFMFAGNSPLKSWKHAATHFALEEIEGVHFIFTVREPKSWLVGLFRKPYHKRGTVPKNLTEFSEAKWRVVDRENAKNALQTTRFIRREVR